MEKWRGGGGGWGLLSFFPWKGGLIREGGLFEEAGGGGGLIEDLRYWNSLNSLPNEK